MVESSGLNRSLEGLNGTLSDLQIENAENNGTIGFFPATSRPGFNGNFVLARENVIWLS